MINGNNISDANYEDDLRIELTMGKLLRTGVMTAAVIIFIGAVYYLILYGFQYPDYTIFKGEPKEFTSIQSIIIASISLRSRGIIMLGLVILILTPIARVIFSLIAFTMQKDYTYTLISSIVLVIILFSFFNII